MKWSSEKIKLIQSKEKLKRDNRISDILEIEKIKFPKRSPFYNGNPNLRNSNTPFDYTEEELSNILKLQNNPKFLSNLVNFTLRDYQEETIDNYLNNRFNIIIKSRQTGMSSVKALLILNYAISNFDKSVVIYSNKISTSGDVMDKVKYFYYSLPFYSKIGIKKWNAKNIEFDNGCRIKCGSRYANTSIVDFLVIDEFAHIPKNILEKFWGNALPTMISTADSKIMIGSTPNGDNIFKELVYNDTNIFNKQWIHYSKVPNRDDVWKNNMINSIGSLENFAQEFELLFKGTAEFNRYVNLEKLV